MKNKICSTGIAPCKIVNPDHESKEKTNTKRKYSIIGILILTISFAIFASVAIPSYNTFFENSKKKIAKNFAAMVAQTANTYYSQNQTTPGYADLGITAPAGYMAALNGVYVEVFDDETPGYTPDPDPNMQSVRWK